MVDLENITLRVKQMLGIDDRLQDTALDIIVSNVQKHLLLRIRRINKMIVEVPEELDFIIEEIAIRRFNNIGSEGMKSESVEGHSITFYELDDYFKPYDHIINDYEDDEAKNDRRGKVMFL